MPSFSDEEMLEVTSLTKKIWPGVILVEGAPGHYESKGGIERLNREVEKRFAHECMKKFEMVFGSIVCAMSL